MGNRVKVIKRTYSLTEPLWRRFEEIVPKRERSRVITELVSRWIEEKERERLRKEILEGCQEMAEVYMEVEKEFHPLEEEVEGTLCGFGWILWKDLSRLVKDRLW